jgi:hypothetical protein
VQHWVRELITAISILVATLVIIFYVIPNNIDLEPEYDLASLSPAFFPNLATWIIAALAGLHIVNLLFQKKKAAAGDGEEEWLSRSEELSAYKSAFVIVLYFFAMKYVGFLISTALVLAALFVLQDIKKPLRVILISILVTVGIFLFFFYVMQVHFPKGAIFE